MVAALSGVGTRSCARLAAPKPHGSHDLGRFAMHVPSALPAQAEPAPNPAASKWQTPMREALRPLDPLDCRKSNPTRD